MPYDTADFNIVCGIAPSGSPSLPPDYRTTDQPCAFRSPTRAGLVPFGVVLSTGATNNTATGQVLFPKGTDVRDRAQYGGVRLDLIEIPYGSKQWWAVQVVQDVGFGWPNEFRIALVGKFYVTGSPYWGWPLTMPPGS